MPNQLNELKYSPISTFTLTLARMSECPSFLGSDFLEPDELGNALVAGVSLVSDCSLLIVSLIGLGYSAARLLYLLG